MIFFLAFAGLLPQLEGLFAEEGLFPVELLHSSLQVPWSYFIPSDLGAFYIFVLGGVAASLLALFNVCTAPLLLLCYVLYYIVVLCGQEFLSFQWDVLVLESGFLAAFVALDRSGQSLLSPRVKGLFAFALQFLLFKLMLMSGLCKIASQDPTWAGLTALTYHFESQPLPGPLALFIHALPQTFLKLACALTLFIELVVPFFIFLGKRGRLIAFFAFNLLQLAIIISGNYCFFNLLTMVLCLPLLDDKTLYAGGRLLALHTRFLYQRPRAELRNNRPLTAISCCIFFLIAWTNATYFLPDMPGRLLTVLPRQMMVANSYGLFAVMTTTRPELIIEGSMDGIHFSPYELPFKPGALQRMPPVVAPYQPRLDWQLWFEALKTLNGSYQEAPSPWFVSMMQKLHQNNKAVLSLYAKSPFAKEENGPNYIRAVVRQYRFSSPQKLFQSGCFWQVSEDEQVYFQIGPEEKPLEKPAENY